MSNQLKTAIDMIAQGYDLELVLNITGVDPEALMDILVNMIGEEIHSTAQVTVVQTLQHFNSDSIGLFKVNIN